MNIRFSGDTRDLFKFDLVRHLMKSFPELASFTFIPMLTDRADANKAEEECRNRSPEGGKSRESRVTEQEPDGIPGKTAGDRGRHGLFYRNTVLFPGGEHLIDVLQKDRFSHEHRLNYFARLFEQFPKKSLVFLDPDTGLEVKNPTRKHLLFDEVKKITDLMDDSSDPDDLPAFSP